MDDLPEHEVGLLADKTEEAAQVSQLAGSEALGAQKLAHVLDRRT
jgi:hypothetical protein